MADWVLGVLGGSGLLLIGSWSPRATWQTPLILTALVLQGFGVGIFQVAYMDMVMRTLPRQHRGVAGSVAMLSRSLGVVTGATLLTLVFHTIEAFATATGQMAAEGFLSGFRATFWLAGVVCALAGLLAARVANIRK